MTFGERLIELRIEKGYRKRNEFADALGIPSTTLRNYETDVREPGHTFLKQISDFFNVSVDYLLCLTDERERILPYNLKSSEFDHIKKYRLISEKDTDGKALVDSTVNYLCNHIHMTQEEDSRLLELKNEKPAKITRLLRYYYGGVSAGSGVYMLNSTESKEIEIPVTPETSKADFVVPVSGNSMEPLFHDGDKILISQSDGTLEIGEIGIFVKNGDAFIKKLGQNELVSLNKEFDNIPLNDFDNVVCLGKVIGRLE